MRVYFPLCEPVNLLVVVSLISTRDALRGVKALGIMPKAFQKSYALFRDMVSEHGARLRKLTYEQLKHLDEATESFKVASRPARISIIVLQLADDKLQIVVQGFIKVRFVPMVSQVALDGFYKYRDERIEPLSREDFYAFD
jgi:hypothetical protein